MIQVRIKVDSHCKTCGAFVPAGSTVWYDARCGCVYCCDACKAMVST